MQKGFSTGWGQRGYVLLDALESGFATLKALFKAGKVGQSGLVPNIHRANNLHQPIYNTILFSKRLSDARNSSRNFTRKAR